MKNSLRNFDKKRRKYTENLELSFYRIISKLSPCENTILAKEDVKKVLILRNNSRIGNIYFLLPFIKLAQEFYSKADIDVMVMTEGQTKILENLNLRNIIHSDFTLKTMPSFVRTIMEVRKEEYDVILMPHNSSTDSIIGSLLKARNKIAFESKKHSIIFKNAIPECEKSHHAALSPLSIFYSLNQIEKEVDHQMQFSADEVEKGQIQTNLLKGKKEVIISFFRGARGKKVISDASWKNLINKVNLASSQTIQWVEILSPDISEKLINEHASYQTNSLRELGAVLSNMDMFFCADTGPLHLADAAGANCVGLFNITTPEQFGCLGNRSLNIDDIEALNPYFVLNHFGIPTNETKKDQTISMSKETELSSEFALSY